jgi:hypothetical protein
VLAGAALPGAGGAGTHKHARNARDDASREVVARDKHWLMMYKE